MNIIKYPQASELENILKRPVFEADFLESTVKNILARVRQGGDQALLKFNEQFDKVKLDKLAVTEEEKNQAAGKISEDLRSAIQTALNNIKKFHEAQTRKEIKIETSKGVTCWRKAVPIEKVGIYIPGGTAPLFSTVLMLGVPASIAGCKEVVLCTPPGSDGKIHPAILYTAQLTGISKIFKTGGAQAIAAMAYGTESISKVDKIFGPGNQYVTAAKQLVSMEGTAIDMPAGPSELAVIADSSCNPVFVASDLLSQAEHGKDSQVVLICPDEDVINKIGNEIDVQVEKLPRKEIARASLLNSKAILVKDLNEAMQVSNQYAPEHLIIATENAVALSEKVINAGSVFIGNYSPESAGDYASGTNHTLPTNGAAKAYSGVSLDSFMKQITFQEITREGIADLGPAIEAMAEAELLAAHKNAVSVRLSEIKKS
ncbi:histidinol dehydrogenase [Fulvivirga kasyanovii]|uniref:Histidinol dehydrogenase n=1 Tax=Fulvivirga kasyanovii TaxID=396812 RepID=A0ABW9RRT7_9BACT|nr:histidinol dehydrogenase [Fulvivirga kasyanovii]MTI26013.1 histidinol dehydrogenase [Fulvivirga kasyanovii]